MFLRGIKAKRNLKHIIHFVSDGATIELPDNVVWCIDGEKLKSDTNTFKIEIEKDFKILMPKKNVKKLFINK